MLVPGNCRVSQFRAAMGPRVAIGNSRDTLVVGAMGRDSHFGHYILVFGWEHPDAAARGESAELVAGTIVCRWDTRAGYRPRFACAHDRGATLLGAYDSA